MNIVEKQEVFQINKTKTLGKEKFIFFRNHFRLLVAEQMKLNISGDFSDLCHYTLNPRF